MKYYILTIFLFATVLVKSQNYWAQKTDLPSSSRYSAVGFSIGDIGYICCGRISPSSLANDLWMYNTTNDSWTQKTSLPTQGLYAPSAFVINGIAYVGNGAYNSGGNSNNFYKYNPTTDSWSQVASFPGSARYGCGFFAINGKGYICGGTTGSMYLADLWEYDPIADSWTQKASIPGSERAHPVCFSINNMGYVTTGKKMSGSYLNDTWKYNPLTNSWSQVGSIGNFGRTVAAGFTINGKGYCGSGVNEQGVELDDFWEFDPITGAWTQVATIDEATGRHGAATFATPTKGYILTGLNTTIYMKDIWEYWPLNASISNQTIKDKIQFYQNLQKQSLEFSVLENQKIQIRIYSITGQIVHSQTINTTTSISMANLPKGAYILRISNEEDQFSTKILHL